MRFLVHGSIAFDLLLQYDGNFADAIDPKSLQKLSVSFVAPRFARHHGGTAVNIAWTLALLKQKPFMVGSVGSDGTAYLELLRERGVSTDFVEVLADASTATAVIGTDKGERQITFFHPGADAKGSLPDFGSTAPDVSYAIVSPRNFQLMLAGAKQCHDVGIPYLFDPGQRCHEFGKKDFRTAVSGSKGLIVNEYEWSLASETLEWKEKDVVDACGLLIVTMGEKGASVITKGGREHVDALPAEKFVNPTGAGDALRAGLLTGLAAEWTPVQAVQLGAAVASMVVAQEGTLLDWLDTEGLFSRAAIHYGSRLPKLPA